jgi:hypothetical protein
MTLTVQVFFQVTIMTELFLIVAVFCTALPEMVSMGRVLFWYMVEQPRLDQCKFPGRVFR